MATPLVRLLGILALTTVAACLAFAAKDAKQVGNIVIKALEDQIHDLRGQEKTALNSLDERFDYVVSVMDPKGIQKELEEILVVLRQVKEDLGKADNLNFGDNCVHAREATEKAERQVERALQHDTAEERAKAGNDIGAVHEDLVKGLGFSGEQPLAGNGPDGPQRPPRGSTCEAGGENDLTAYLAMMTLRLAELHGVLRPTGNLHWHCDPTASNYLKLFMDAVFAPKVLPVPLPVRQAYRLGRDRFGRLISASVKLVAGDWIASL